MKAIELADKLGCPLLTPTDAGGREVTGCYIGDLLSYVMGRASKGNAWITIMTNINIAAVALLTEMSCIILAENNTVDADVVKKCAEEGIAIMTSPKTSYQLAAEISRLI